MTKGLLPSEVLLDNQANISIVHPRLLKNVRDSKHQINVKGVGGVQLIVDKVGDLDGFFQVYASEHTTANVLCFADVEDRYAITYEKGKVFTVQLAGGKMVEFVRRNKLYVADWSTTGLFMYATVRENEQVYTREEVRRAKLAYELIRNSGYPSANEVVHLIHDGNVRGMPSTLSKADVERAYRIYGVHPEYVRGQMTNQKVSRAQVDLGLRSTEKRLRLYVDVMHVDARMFLISVTDLLNLTLQASINSENRLELGMALQGHMAILRSRGYQPGVVYTDPHSSFKSVRQDFPGVELDIGGAGDYVSKVDAKIHRIKETYRKVKAGLPWELPGQLVADLVSYCVSRLNIRRTTALAENICPRVLFTGIPVDYRKELTCVFGDYVEAYEGTTNTSRARCAACIALYPAGNSIGSWVLWKIDTRSRVRRSNVAKLVTTEKIISIMNAVAQEEYLEDVWAMETPQSDAVETPAEMPEENPERNLVETQDGDPEENPLESQEVTADVNEENNEEPEEATIEQPARVTTRSGREVVRPSRYAAVTKVSQGEWKQEHSDKAIKKELTQLFKEMVAKMPVKKDIIPSNAPVLNSHMFLVNKYHAYGEFEKVKARLVADGCDQDSTLCPNKSSPTVAIHSVFTVLGMAGEKSWRIVVKIHIKGAFVQTPMSGPPIFMKIDPKIVKYTKELYPELEEYQWKDQCIYTVMLKAMYGCIQASALWYALIRGEFEQMGYVVSETDKCVFIKQVGEEKRFTLLLHVDDILALVDQEESDLGKAQAYVWRSPI
jgi:hypothetical protein